MKLSEQLSGTSLAQGHFQLLPAQHGPGRKPEVTTETVATTEMLLRFLNFVNSNSQKAPCLGFPIWGREPMPAAGWGIRVNRL